MRVNDKWGSRAEIAIIALMLITIPAFAQEINQKLLNNVSMDIVNNNPKVESPLLAKDQEVIKSAFPAIKTNFGKKGFSESDINSAIATSWLNLRSPSSPLASFDESAFLNYITKLGKLKIESKPVGANIDIDKNLVGITNTIKWLAPRRYRFLISKAGFISEEEERDVVEGDNPPLIKILKPIGP